jgi:hypothetical protein
VIEEHSTSDLCRERRSERNWEEAMRGDWRLVGRVGTIQLLKNTPMRILEGFIVDGFIGRSMAASKICGESF